MRSGVLLVFATASLLAGCMTPTSAPSPTSQTTSAATSAPASATPGPTRTVTPTLTLPEQVDLTTLGALHIDARPSPDFAVVADGFLFVGGVGEGIAQLDRTGQQVQTWTVPGESCGAMDVGFGSVWSATCEAPGLARIDVESGTLTPIELGGVMPDSESSVATGAGAVWVVIGDATRTLLRVDPDSNTVTDRYPIPPGSIAVRAGEGAVWIADPPNDEVHRVDPATGEVVTTIEVGARPQFLTVGLGAVWTMDQNDGTVSRIDPASNAVVATIRLGEVVRGGDIATGGGFLWLRGSQTLQFKIDPASNEIVARYGPNAGSGSVAADDTAVWITDHDTFTIWRLPLS
jgi:virginiamycin B lyase